MQQFTCSLLQICHPYLFSWLWQEAWLLAPSFHPLTVLGQWGWLVCPSTALEQVFPCQCRLFTYLHWSHVSKPQPVWMVLIKFYLAFTLWLAQLLNHLGTYIKHLLKPLIQKGIRHSIINHSPFCNSSLRVICVCNDSLGCITSMNIVVDVLFRDDETVLDEQTSHHVEKKD